MADQQIRDKNNRLMATIHTTWTSTEEIRDPAGRLLGTYDPKKNETRDPAGRFVAKGNALTSFIRPI
jgi:YD repeat-containing protein